MINITKNSFDRFNPIKLKLNADSFWWFDFNNARVIEAGVALHFN